MKIRQAKLQELEPVKEIVHRTIKAVYPHYYPVGAVDFFLAHHCDEHILKDIEAGNVFLLEDEEKGCVGTVTTKENELTRLFVLPELQGKGCGSELIRFAEERIAESHGEIVLDASLPAKAIYLRKGYEFLGYHTIECTNGDQLCYDEMIKHIVHNK